jgi:hypothetical protein
MAWARLRYIAVEIDDHPKYPFVVTAWRNVGDIYCGDRFSRSVGDILIEAWREDGIEVSVKAASSGEGGYETYAETTPVSPPDLGAG